MDTSRGARIVSVDNAGARHNLAWPDKLESDMKPELPIHRDTLVAGSRPVLGCILHVATHALCQVRGVSETSNRGQRHNKRFAAMAGELGMKWPEGEPPHPVRGFSPVPLTEEGEWRYVAILQALDVALADADKLQFPEVDGKGKSGSRITLECRCDPRRTFQIGRRVAAQGPIMCGVCGAEFTER